MSNHLELMRDQSKLFPPVDEPEGIESVRVWHCKYKTLEPISGLRNLRGLAIATFPDDDLRLLSELTALEYLRILHLPKVGDLSPLIGLSRLKVVRFSTLPSWDSSGKTTTVESLEPLAQLPHLENLELFGVTPPKCSLHALEESASLTTVRVSKYPDFEVERFRSATGATDDWAPEPWF